MCWVYGTHFFVFSSYCRLRIWDSCAECIFFVRRRKGDGRSFKFWITSGKSVYAYISHFYLEISPIILVDWFLNRYCRNLSTKLHVSSSRHESISKRVNKIQTRIDFNEIFAFPVSTNIYPFPMSRNVISLNIQEINYHHTFKKYMQLIELYVDLCYTKLQLWLDEWNEIDVWRSRA